MRILLLCSEPVDYVIGTGETYRVGDFVQIAFDRVGLNWEDHVVIDPKFYRPAEVDLLLADPKKSQEELNWKPKMSFQELVETMVDHDLARLAHLAKPELKVVRKSA